jgi:hypothetical protein
MIQMRVRERDGVNVRRPDGQRVPVAFAKFLQALEKAAVNEQLPAADVEQMLGTCDRTCRSEKSQIHVHAK